MLVLSLLRLALCALRFPIALCALRFALTIPGRLPDPPARDGPARPVTKNSGRLPVAVWFIFGILSGFLDKRE